MGSAVCGLLGPGIAIALLSLLDSQTSLLEVPILALKGWIFAFISVGPAALVFGAACGLLLSALLRKYRSPLVSWAGAAVLGPILGTAVDVATVLVNVLLDRTGARHAVLSFAFAPLGAATGLVCAFLLASLLRRFDTGNARSRVAPGATS